MSNFDFTGNHIFITGGSSGIGYAVASQFVQAGGSVVIFAADDEVEEAGKKLQSMGKHQVLAIKGDVTDKAAVASAVQQTDKIDVLINNAGIGMPVDIMDTSDAAEATFRRVVDINLLGSYFVTRESLQKMASGGRIINTCSVVGRGKLLAGMSPYSASKAALQGFTQALAAELGPRNITVNSVCPGATRVGWMEPDIIFEIAKTAYPQLAEAGLITRDNAEQISTIGMPLGDGYLQPEDIASTYLFLASEGAADITGQCIHVDRGDVMR